MALADSLALPRLDEAGNTAWEDTWPYRLPAEGARRGLLLESINCGERRRTVSTLKRDFTEHILLKRPRIVVLQVGIVDCAPRIISRRLHRVMNLRWFPGGLRRRIIARRSARRAELIRPDPLARVYTRPEPFDEALRSFGDRLDGLDWTPGVVVLPILGDLDVLEGKSPGFGRNIERYNAVLQRHADRRGWVWIDPSEWAAFGEGLFASDGYHLSPSGHRSVASIVADRVAELVPAADGEFRPGAPAVGPD